MESPRGDFTIDPNIILTFTTRPRLYQGQNSFTVRNFTFKYKFDLFTGQDLQNFNKNSGSI